MTSPPVAPGDRSVPWQDVFPPTCYLKPIKYVCSINRCSLPETTDPDTEFRYVDISSVDAEGNWVASEPMRFADAPSRARRVVKDGDVLVSTVRTYLRAITHVNKVEEPLICSTGFAVLTASGAVHSKFLAYWVRSVCFVDEVVARSVGVSYPAVNASDVGNIPCPIMPFDKQQAIAAYLDRETSRIDALIEKKRRQIELLQEKRAALISNAVTKGLDPVAG
jgi:type I restriction enzyme S subunit